MIILHTCRHWSREIANIPFFVTKHLKYDVEPLTLSWNGLLTMRSRRARCEKFLLFTYAMLTPLRDVYAWKRSTFSPEQVLPLCRFEANA